MRKKLLALTMGNLLLLANFSAQAANDLPATATVKMGAAEEVCSNFTDPEWRNAQTIDGVTIQESRLCNPDNQSCRYSGLR